MSKQRKEPKPWCAQPNRTKRRTNLNDVADVHEAYAQVNRVAATSRVPQRHPEDDEGGQNVGGKHKEAAGHQDVVEGVPLTPVSTGGLLEQVVLTFLSCTFSSKNLDRLIWFNR